MNQRLNSAVVDGVILSNTCINKINSHGLISQKYRKPKLIGYTWVTAEDLGDKFFNKQIYERSMHRVIFLMLTFTCLRIGSLIAIQCLVLILKKSYSCSSILHEDWQEFWCYSYCIYGATVCLLEKSL